MNVSILDLNKVLIDCICAFIICLNEIGNLCKNKTSVLGDFIDQMTRVKSQGICRTAVKSCSSEYRNSQASWSEQIPTIPNPKLDAHGGISPRATRFPGLASEPLPKKQPQCSAGYRIQKKT